MGVDRNPPNYDWSESTGASGFSVDVFNEAARRSGVKLEWVYAPGGARKALIDGLIDFWPMAYYRPGEYPMLHQTRPWSEDQHAFIWDRGRFFEMPETWKDKRMAAMDRQATQVLARRMFPDVKLIPAATRRDTVRLMCEGKADVAFLDMRAIEFALLTRPPACDGLALQVKPMPNLTDPMSLYSRNEVGPLAEILRDRIDDMAADGTIAKLAEKWYSFASTDLRRVSQLQNRARQIRWLTGVCVLMVVLLGLFSWLIRNLRHARSAAERSRQLQADFLANVSHEIRTPMNGVLGMTELLLDTVEDPETRDQIETIKESAHGQLELLNQVLDQSKIDSGALLLEITPFSIRRLVEQVEKSFQPTARRKGIMLEVHLPDDPPAQMLGDGLRIRQVLSNLVNNALKFTAEGSVDIWVVTVSGERTVEVSICVSDTGIGIPREALALVFDKFRQVDSTTTRRFGGTGLGLSISRHLVHLMGGTLTVESEVGKGSRFQFNITLAVGNRRAEQEPATGASKSVSLHKMRVLLVEDNTVNQRVAQAMLERLGASVSLAVNGAEAVSKCKASRFDAILMDCHMPEMDGFEATAAIRELDGYFRTVPIIALTAGVSSDERKRAFRSGMDGFLAKPVNRDELAATLAALPRHESPAV